MIRQPRNLKLCTFDDLHVGQQASFTKTITNEDITHFIKITGDTNPLHVDADFTARTFFREPIAHGMLAGAMFTHVIGMLLPGTGAIYRSQSLTFLRPVYINDTICTLLEIVNIDQEKELIKMQGVIHNQHDQEVIEGTSTATLLRGFAD